MIDGIFWSLFAGRNTEASSERTTALICVQEICFEDSLDEISHSWLCGMSAVVFSKDEWGNGYSTAALWSQNSLDYEVYE